MHSVEYRIRYHRPEWPSAKWDARVFQRWPAAAAFRRQLLAGGTAHGRTLAPLHPEHVVLQHRPVGDWTDATTTEGPDPMNRSKQKGTAAETAVVRYLHTRGWLHAERRALSGSQDRGDVAGIPGVVIEVKNCKRDELGAWVDEAEQERANDGAVHSAVWHKRRGTTDPGAWFVTMTGEQYADLLIDAGHGDSAPTEKA